MLDLTTKEADSSNTLTSQASNDSSKVSVTEEEGYIPPPVRQVLSLSRHGAITFLSVKTFLLSVESGQCIKVWTPFTVD